jgi:hypothetical protein
MKRTMKVLAAIAGVFVMLGLSTAGTAGAAGTATVTPNPITVSQGQTSATVTVDYNFGAANTAVFIDICRKPKSDPTFDYTLDCDSGSANAYNGSANGGGSKQYDVFVGHTVGWDLFASGKWGCYPTTGDYEAGFDGFTTCYIRVTQGSVDNQTDAVTVPYTFSKGGTNIPEAPYVVLPVLLAAVTVGGVLYFNRRRQALA